jgi:hypothetical protein
MKGGVCMDEKKLKNMRRLVKKHKPNFVSLDRLVLVCTETANNLLKRKRANKLSFSFRNKNMPYNERMD